MRTPQVVVVGAGIGGLTAALELQARGCAVTVLEAQNHAGGKIRQIAGIDSGPTVFTMRWIFDDLFEALGIDLEQSLKLSRIDLLARHRWPDGANLDLWSDLDRSADAIAALSGSTDARRYLTFMATARRVFETLEPTFMRSPRPSVGGLVLRIARRNPAGLTAIHPFRTLAGELERTFNDPRLRQLFGRFATYCGSSPYQSPATLMLIAHAEQCGVWLLDGGMARLATAFAETAERFGARVRYGTMVRELLVEAGQTTGVMTAAGERIAADAVVFNGDVSAIACGKLGNQAVTSTATVPRTLRSQSAVTWTGRAEVAGIDLAAHTVAFGPDYRDEFDAVFQRRDVPSMPTVYLHAPDRGFDIGGGIPGQQRLFALINAPADGDDTHRDHNELLARAEAALTRSLRNCGVSLTWSPREVTRTGPADFERMFPASGGALYGRVSHGWQASFARQGTRTRLARLYLAGGSVHPGAGVPMACLSGRLAAAEVLADLQRLTKPGWSGATRSPLRTTHADIPTAEAQTARRSPL